MGSDCGQEVALPCGPGEDGGLVWTFLGTDAAVCVREEQLRSRLMQVVGLPAGYLGSEQQQLEPG